jgi:hypothetical protein
VLGLASKNYFSHPYGDETTLAYPNLLGTKRLGCCSMGQQTKLTFSLRKRS